ncbi:jasmonic acid-amido synthetase JAR1-like [Senna tora]|uniref:Jasmonic acid-amido synthetase JAR1-like n=1 Tax=Senna tora TaxID=362788 RepID=A0A834THV9_9FABA|nr:jasmonic acid-amido synthetase JAR1-like [Senna tora]
MPKKEEEFNAEEVIEEFEYVTKNAEAVQKETLRRILEANASAEYLQSLGLNGRTDPVIFKACVPVVTHKELEPYIQRIIDGDDAACILTGKPITTISLSSGTTQGKPKFVPWNDELFDTTMQIYQTSFAFRKRHFPINNGKVLSFIYASRQFKTKGGLIAGTATTNLFRDPRYKTSMKAIQSQHCSPDEVILFSSDFQQSLYCHLLCGLISREHVQVVSSTFAHSLVHAFRFFEQVWEELCTDIREGVLTSRITDPSIRAAMANLLVEPNQESASSIHDKCAGLSDWYGLIPQLFPNTKFVYGIMTGSMEPYLKKLRHYAGEVPLVTADYGSSEGWIGANVNPRVAPESATYAVLPQIGYFEFIPMEKKIDDDGDGNRDGGDPQTVGLMEVKVGEEYEIVITNPAGLYRYRLGDVVKVMGFHNSTPELKFVRRASLLLSVNIDKNTEKDLQLAVEAATELLAEDKLEVVDFTSHVDLSTEPGHYVIFWEINGVDDNEASDELLSKCCDRLDESFVDAGYKSARKVKCIGPLELRVLRKGTFQKILQHFLGLGGAVSQYKTPRCIGPANSVVLQILSENVVKS